MKTLRRTTPAVPAILVVLAVTLAGCGGAGGGGGGGDAESDLPDSARASSEDEEGTLYPLRAGRYRLSYRAPGCQDVVVSITEASGAFTYEQQQRVTTSFVNDVVDGEYTIAITSDCDEWSVALDEF